MARNLESHLHAQSESGRRLFWHRLRWDAVKAYLPRNSALLVDVGAGAGHLAEYLAEDRPAIRYAFVEPIPSMRAHLRARHGEAADLEGHDRFEAVGFVTLLDVLEHQADDLDFLTQLYARMESGARLIITVPALPVLWSAWDEGLGHHRRYVKSGLRRVIVDAGFFIEELSYLFPELIPTALYRRFSLSRGGSDAAAELELPVPSAPVNETLYAVGWLSQRFRRLYPAGTSLLAVVKKR